MSYPDVIRAGALRQGDRVYTARAERRMILATFCPVGTSFMRILIEGDNEPRLLPIGAVVYIERTAA